MCKLCVIVEDADFDNGEPPCLCDLGSSLVQVSISLQYPAEGLELFTLPECRGRNFSLILKMTEY